MTETIVKTADQALILDGPNEVIAKKLAQLSESNKQAILARKIKSKQEVLRECRQQEKTSYAKAFIDYCAKFFEINRFQVSDLIATMKDSDIEIVESKILKRIKGGAVIEFLIGSMISVITFGLMVAGIIMRDPMWLFACLLLFLIFLLTSVDVFSTGLISNKIFHRLAYIFTGRRLKKKYGQDYFPIQELREELGLVPKKEETT